VALVEEKPTMKRTKKIYNGDSLHGGGLLVLILATRCGCVKGEASGKVVSYCRDRGHRGRGGEKR
jgi:hypothetical protein